MRTIELDGSNFMQVSTLHTKRVDGKNTCAAPSKRSALVIVYRETVFFMQTTISSRPAKAEETVRCAGERAGNTGR
jgi:hypothetical protein